MENHPPAFSLIDGAFICIGSIGLLALRESFEINKISNLTLSKRSTCGQEAPPSMTGML